MPDRLGPYSLLDRIGEGGMGVVFLARDATDRTVALKVLRSSVAGEPTARRRLAREVETMRRVRSPYVAEVIDADLAGDMPYIATRYVPGRTLEDVVTQGGPLPPAALLRLVCGLSDALSAVHAAGVVHRDLKPSNVMLQGEVPVVIDFGIAQGPDATRLTMTGMFMGTPGYLAPEVIEGQPSSEASDIHAWGATVAFAAVGHPPFGTGAYEAIFYRIVNGQPDLTGVPPVLLPLLAAALNRDPALRPPAVQLSAQAAVLSPEAFVAGNGFGSNAMAPPLAAMPATRADVPVGPAVPAAPGFAPPGTAPLASGQPPPADFHDVLPPVQYTPARSRPPGAGAAAFSPGSPFAPRPARGSASARWHSGLVIGTMVVAVSVSVILPVVGTAVALALIMALRAGELAQQRAAVRRSARGERAGDTVLQAALFPWYLARAVLGALLMIPFALAAAVVAGGAAIVAAPSHQLSRAVAVAAGTLVAFYGLGPGSGRNRRQLHRIYDAAISTRIAQAVALAGMTALALAALTAAISWPSVYWPTVPPGGFWHFGVIHVRRLGNLGIAGRLLLAHLRRW